MKSYWVVRPMIAVFLFSFSASAQTGSSGAAASVNACPVELTDLHASGVRVRVKNISGKKIVGLVFNAALSDATERWKWLHWDYDQSRPLQEFGWNKRLNEGETKKLSWGMDLEHEHGGGLALVLTSVLFADGSSWEESDDRATCKEIWYNNHKKGFTKPVQLPRRE